MDEENTIFFEELKKTRKSKKISLKEIAEYTKINTSYLESLESGDFDVLPNAYNRLFLRSYCNYIGVDYKAILNQYEIHTLGDKKKDISEAESLDDQLENLKEVPSNTKLNLNSKSYKEITVTTIVVIILIILFIVISTINTA